MTVRSHETIRVGLRRIIRDPSARTNMRMDAIKMLMRVEELMEEAGLVKNKPVVAPINNRLRELMELAEGHNPG